MPYRCTSGKLTIGIGRNLDDNGITEQEAMILLHNDIVRVKNQLSHLPEYLNLDEVRRTVLANMCFNLGIGGLRTFKKMLSALDHGDYDKAADEMLESKWAHQVGKRAVRLARQMRTGSFE